MILETARSLFSRAFDVGRIIVTQAFKLTFEMSTNGACQGVNAKTIDDGALEPYSTLSFPVIHLSALLGSILVLEAGALSLLLLL